MDTIFILPQWLHFTVIIHEENIQGSFARFSGVNGEICFFIRLDNLLQSRAVALHLAGVVVCLGEDLRHVGAARDVLVVAEDVHGVLPGHGGHVVHVRRAVAVVVAVDLGLGRTLDGEAQRPGLAAGVHGEEGGHVHHAA